MAPTYPTNSGGQTFTTANEFKQLMQQPFSPSGPSGPSLPRYIGGRPFLPGGPARPALGARPPNVLGKRTFGKLPSWQRRAMRNGNKSARGLGGVLNGFPVAKPAMPGGLIKFAIGMSYRINPYLGAAGTLLQLLGAFDEDPYGIKTAAGPNSYQGDLLRLGWVQESYCPGAFPFNKYASVGPAGPGFIPCNTNLIVVEGDYGQPIDLTNKAWVCFGPQTVIGRMRAQEQWRKLSGAVGGLIQFQPYPAAAFKPIFNPFPDLYPQIPFQPETNPILRPAFAPWAAPIYAGAPTVNPHPFDQRGFGPLPAVRTDTRTNPTRVPTGYGPPHDLRPPRPGEKEGKKQVPLKTWQRITKTLASGITDTNDILDAAFSSLPKKCQYKNGQKIQGAVGRSMAVYRCIGQMDIGAFIKRVILNDITDRVHGGVGQHLQKAVRNNPYWGGLRGLQHGGRAFGYSTSVRT